LYCFTLNEVALLSQLAEGQPSSQLACLVCPLVLCPHEGRTVIPLRPSLIMTRAQRGCRMWEFRFRAVAKHSEKREWFSITVAFAPAIIRTLGSCKFPLRQAHPCRYLAFVGRLQAKPETVEYSFCSALAAHVSVQGKDP
jgi:hypothetical protein